MYQRLLWVNTSHFMFSLMKTQHKQGTNMDVELSLTCSNVFVNISIKIDFVC